MEEQGSTPSYPMDDISLKYHLNHLHIKDKTEELVSNAVVLSGGVTILFAGVKEGKTFLALQLAVCASIGHPFLTFSTKPGKVLYLTFEGGTPYLIERAEEIAKNNFPSALETVLTSIDVMNFAGECLDTPSGIDNLRGLLNKYRPKYLFLDPLDLGIAGDYSKPFVARKCMEALIQIAEEFELGIIAISHARKGWKRKGPDFEALIGSTLWAAMPATVIELKRLNGEAELNFIVRYGPPIQPLRLRFNEEKLLFEVLERPPREGERAEEAILEVLQALGCTMLLKDLIKEVQKRAGVHPNTINSARHRLEVKGLIKTERIPGSAAKKVYLTL